MDMYYQYVMKAEWHYENLPMIYEGWPGKLCTLLIFSLFDALLAFNFSNTFCHSNSIKEVHKRYNFMYNL